MTIKKYAFPAWLLLMAPAVSMAMDALSEQEMGAVSGRDGVTLSLQTSTGITADQVKWSVDSGTTQANSLRVGKFETPEDGFKIIPIDMDGLDASQPLDISVAIDAYTNNSGRVGLGIDTRWNRMRVQMDSLSVSDDTRSFGGMALDSAGRFALFGDGGLLNSAASPDPSARLILNIGNVDASNNWAINDPAQLFFRTGGAGEAEAQLDNLGFLLDMHKGTVGIDDEGFLVKSAPGSRTDFNLSFDVFATAANTAATEFQKTALSKPLLFFGWRGGLEDFLFRLRSGGLPDGSGGITEGISSSLGFDLASDFQFVVGEAGDNRSYLEFGAPERLPSSSARKDVEFGYLGLDVVSANQGAGGICFGGSNAPGVLASCVAESYSSLPAQTIELPPSSPALALIARNWGLHAYSSNVVYRDATDSSRDEEEGWALIYTLGDINSNIYLYPQEDSGIKMDVVAAIQTLGNTEQSRWENGTHLMIGDTEKDLAIGLVGSDLLFAAEQMGVSISTGGGLELATNRARLQLRGMFGGGTIPDMSDGQYISYIDANLEFDKLVFNLLYSLDGTFLPYGGYLSFDNLDGGFANDAGGVHGHDDGSYISLAEPSFDKLGVDIRFANITGDIEIPVGITAASAGGKIDLIPATASTKPKLRIENRMLIGTSATDGEPLKVGSVEFGGKSLGSIVMPGGQIQTSLTLRQQQ